MTEELNADTLAGKDIVVIDDDINSLDVASIVLEFAGAKVSLAENGKEGLAQISKVNPFLVLSDISMPVMDGWAFIQQLRSDDQYKDLTVIALTAHAMIGDRDRVLQAGFDGYLTKPLHPAKFVKDLLSVMENINKNKSISTNNAKD